MKRTRSAIVVVLVLTAAKAILLNTYIAHAMSIVLSPSEMVDIADTIVLGSVVSSHSQWDVSKNSIYTEVDVSVTNILKGKAGKKKISIIMPGGTVGNIAQWVEDSPILEVGEEVGLFLEDLDSANLLKMGIKRTNQSLVEFPVGRIIGGLQGKRSIAKDSQSAGKKIYADKFINEVQMTLEGQSIIEVKNELLLEANTSSPYEITSIWPTSASAGTDTVVFVTGSGFGAPGPGFNGLCFFSREFYYSGSGMVPNYICSPYISWSDTQITANVPVLYENPNYRSSSSGPLYITKGGTDGSLADFNVRFGYGQASWPGNSPIVKFKVNDGGIAGRRNAILAAMEIWNYAGARFAFSYDGNNAQTDYAQNGVNEIFWTSNLPAGVMAQNRSTCYVDSGDCFESDIGFNTAYTWNYLSICPSNQNDIQFVATHELGHSLRLLDLYGNMTGYSKDIDKMMYGLVEAGQMKRALTDDEKRGIRWIYGTNPLLAISLAGIGLWEFNPYTSTWRNITPDYPENTIYMGTTLYGDFGALGLWRWNGHEWTWVTGSNPENMIVVDSTLYVDFGAIGLWKWDGTSWAQLTSSNPENMVTWGSVLCVDFGAIGLWKWDGTSWTQLTSSNPENMVTAGTMTLGDFGALYGDFGTIGLWKWNGSSWVQLTPSNPENMVVADSTLYAEFGAGGIWRWNSTSWAQLTPSNPENMVVAGSTLYAEFGAGGIWRWNGTSWTQITGYNPTTIATSN
jgi:hypothetical protein